MKILIILGFIHVLFMEWITEPNEMKFNHLGIACEIRRSCFGNLNVYVLISENNIFYGIDELNLSLILKFEDEITYSQQMGDLWKIGIDFGHLKDYVPDIKEDELTESIKSMMSQFGFKEPTINDYKNFEYAIEKAKKLAEAVSVKNKII